MASPAKSAQPFAPSPLPTPPQREAANPAQSVWVTANAGTGKTKVLTDRVLRLLLLGTLPDRILCLTYTRAAAAEMTNRLQRELAKWVALPDEWLQKELATLTGAPPPPEMLTRARRLFLQVMEAPEGVRMLTIHSLCSSLLRRFALEAKLSPYFRLMDDTQTRQLQEMARHLLLSGDRTLPQLTGTHAQSLAALAGRLSLEDFDKMIADIIAHYPQIEDWFAEAGGAAKQRRHICEVLGCDETLTPEALAQNYVDAMRTRLSDLQTLAQAVDAAGTADKKKKFQPVFDWLAQPNTIPDTSRLTSFFITRDYTPNKQNLTKGLVEYLPTAPEIMQREQVAALEYYHTLFTLQARDKSLEVLEVAEMLVALYRELKDRRGLIDYHDLIHHTARLLKTDGIAPWILFRLDSGIDHLLVDEAQDTAPTQWSIIRLLAAEFFTGESARLAQRTLFVVGDEKQSIYGFQGADPAEFMQSKQLFAKQIQQAQQPWQSVNLLDSYRSTPAVLALVDAVFNHPQPIARDGVLESGMEMRHIAFRSSKPGRVELWPLFTGEEDDQPPAVWPVPDTRNARRNVEPQAQCARAVARTIAEWLAQKRPLPAKGRAIEPGDILLLVRSRNPFYYRLLRALKQEGVPVAGEDRLQLLEQLAVQDVLAAADFCLLPEDDLSLACLLKSPLFDVSEEELYTLCQPRRGSLWQAVQEHQPGIAQTLQRWRHFSQNRRPYEFFAAIIEGEGGRQKLAARLGAQVHDPLNDLLELARDYEISHLPSLQHFMQDLRREDIIVKREIGQDSNQIRVMTVHNSKGLQAPVVMLPDSCGSMVQAGRLLWHEDAVFTAPGDAKYSPAIFAMKEQRKATEQQERNRLLYVALTRAEDELYIGGYKSLRAKQKEDDSPAEAADEAWYSLVKQGMESLAAQALPDGTLRYEDAGYASISVTPTTHHSHATPQTTPPVWLQQNAAQEPTPPRPLMPSRPQEAEPPQDSPITSSDASLALRGTVIHRLLEVLPGIPTARQAQAAQIVLAQYRSIPAEQSTAWLNEAMAILNNAQFAPVFATGSLAEVPITALLPDGRVLSGRIDRLAVLPDRILLVDYKTSRRVPASETALPAAFRSQMTAYAQALTAIYPGRRIEAAIVWTAAAKLMPLAI